MAAAGWLAGQDRRFVEAELWGIDLGQFSAPSRGGARASRSPLLVRWATEEDVAPLSQAMGLPTPYVASRLARGKRCCVAELGGQVASYGWLSTGQEQIPEFERAVRLGPRAAYIWDCLTLPDHRGRGLMPALLRQMVAGLPGQGIRRAWAVILAGNFSSQRAFRRAGFLPVLTITYHREAALHDLILADDPAAPPALIAAAKRLFGHSRR